MKILIIDGQKTGKTTVALSLAKVFTGLGAKVSLTDDMDDARHYLDNDKLLEALSNIIKDKEIIIETAKYNGQAIEKLGGLTPDYYDR